MKKIAVIGFGISGRSAAAFLLKEGCRVVAFDKKAAEYKLDPQNHFSENFELLSDSGDPPFEGISQAVLSPGIPLNHPMVQKFLARGVEVVGEIELAFRHLKNRCIGITGSNGKTTTVLLLAHCLNSAGKKARAVGNVGFSLTNYLIEADEKEILIVELSSFQIETLSSRCLEAAAILNITPNHLDRYPSMAEYAQAKAKIQTCFKNSGKLFVSKQVVENFKPLLNWDDLTVFDGGDAALSTIDQTLAPIPSERYIQLGMPERENIRAAFAIASHLGVSEEEFLRGLKTFRKPPHRIEWVADLSGVSYYNDSKSSNIDSVMHAMALFTRPIVLIAGGVDKGASYSPWIESFKGKVKKIVAFGQASRKMEEELTGFYPFSRVQTLEEAVADAGRSAKQNDIVLLSPGCSSYDQFRNFEHRGEEFKRLVYTNECKN